MLRSTGGYQTAWEVIWGKLILDNIQMKKLGVEELSYVEGGKGFDCALAAAGMGLVIAGFILAPPVGLAAGIIGVGGYIGGIAGLARSCSIT